MSADPLVVLAAPLHGPSAKRHPAALARAVRRVGPTMAGFTEGYAVLGALEHRLPGYRLVVEEGAADKRRGQKDTPVVVRAGLESLGSGQVYACDASTPRRIAPERWFTFAAQRVPGHGPVCLVNVHPHAGVQDRHGKLLRRGGDVVDRAVQYARSMDVLDRLLTFTAAMGWATVVTGDLNWRDHGTDGASPWELLRRHGLQTHDHGIIGLAASPRLKLHVAVYHAPESVTDHPWLVGTSR